MTHTVGRAEHVALRVSFWEHPKNNLARCREGFGGDKSLTALL